MPSLCCDISYYEMFPVSPNLKQDLLMKFAWFSSIFLSKHFFGFYLNMQFIWFSYSLKHLVKGLVLFSKIQSLFKGMIQANIVM